MDTALIKLYQDTEWFCFRAGPVDGQQTYICCARQGEVLAGISELPVAALVFKNFQTMGRALNFAAGKTLATFAPPEPRQPLWREA